MFNHTFVSSTKDERLTAVNDSSDQGSPTSSTRFIDQTHQAARQFPARHTSFIHADHNAGGLSAKPTANRAPGGRGQLRRAERHTAHGLHQPDRRQRIHLAPFTRAVCGWFIHLTIQQPTDTDGLRLTPFRRFFDLYTIDGIYCIMHHLTPLMSSS